MRFSRRVFSLLAATQRCSKTPWRSLCTVQLTKWWEYLSTTKHIKFKNNNNLWNRHGNTTTDLESFRATSSIEFILSILARNDNRSERREETKSRSWRNSSCKAYVRTRVQMHHLKNDAYLQLLHLEAKLRTASMHQRVERNIMRAFIGFSQKSTGITATFLLLLLLLLLNL